MNHSVAQTIRKYQYSPMILDLIITVALCGLFLAMFGIFLICMDFMSKDICQWMVA